MKIDSIYWKNGFCTLLRNFCQNSVRVNFQEKRKIWMTEDSWYLTRYVSAFWIRFPYVSYWFCHFDLSWAFHILRNYRLGSDLLQSLEEKNTFQMDAQYMYNSVEILGFFYHLVFTWNQCKSISSKTAVFCNFRSSENCKMQKFQASNVLKWPFLRF